jgi:hypothetical protein
MNWSHGLLRAWVLVTFLWIGFCGYRLVADWPVFRLTLVFERAAPFNSSFTSTTSPPELIAKAKKEGATRHKQSVQEHILRIAVQAIQPPAVLLALGFAVLWVSSGFRKP